MLTAFLGQSSANFNKFPSRDSYEAEEALLNESEKDVRPHRAPRCLRGSRRFGVVMVIIFSYALVGFVGVWVGSKWVFNPDRFATRYVSQFSPVVKDVDINYSVIRFNGSLMKENIYRQDASPEVDEAWEALGVNYHSLVVPESEAAGSGIAPDQVKIRPKYGGGYVANVEGLHQLHCLNLLRQSLYYNYDYYKRQGNGAFVNEDHIVRLHVSHCLDIIRQQLMCTVDLGVLGQVWWNPPAPRAYVDFNTRHTCRNFDAVREYARVRQLPAQVPPDFLEPPKAGDRVYEEMP